MDTANIWLIRQREGRADPSELRAWLEASPSHSEAYRRAASVYNVVERPAARVMKKARRSHSRQIAAIILLSVGAGWMLRDLPLRFTSTVTEAGETRDIALPDGSHVELNTHSAASVDYSGTERKVTLKRGEAWFNVARNTARPFVVHADDVRVTVLGTKFNVRRLDDSISISVAEGLVQVRDSHKSTLLEAGQAVLVSGEQFAVSDIAPARVAEWRAGWAGFEQTTFETVIEELSRYHRGMLFIADSQLRDRPISARFDVRSPETALKMAVTAASASMVELPGGVRIIF